MLSDETFLDSEQRVFGERVTEALRWFFVATLAALNNLGVLGASGAQVVTNWTLLAWAAENAAVTVALVRHRAVGGRFLVVTTAFDICVGVALVYETDGYSSPYLLGLFVTIIAASVRFGTLASLVSATAISVLYLTAGAVAPLSGTGGQVMGVDLIGRLVLFDVVAIVTGVTSSALVSQRRRALEEAAESESLFEMAAAMASSLNVKEVFEILLKQAKAATDADSGALLRVSAGGMMVAASIGSTPRVDASLLLQGSTGGTALRGDAGRMLLVAIPPADGNGFVVQLSRAGGFRARDSFRVEKLASVGRIAIANAFSYGARMEEATRDALTGSLNRREFERRLSEELSRISRGGLPLCVMLIDVDRFKAVNDTYGHARGDEVLCTVVQLAANVVRAHDVIGRLGGDEFAILLPDCELPAARSVAERLLIEVRAAAMPAGAEGCVTLSIGISAGHRDGCDAATLLRSADTALYQVKREGRDGLGSAVVHSADSACPGCTLVAEPGRADHPIVSPDHSGERGGRLSSPPFTATAKPSGPAPASPPTAAHHHSDTGCELGRESRRLLNVRTLHTSFRVTDLDASLKFYRALGYEQVGQVDLGEGARLTMLKFPSEDAVSLELVHRPADGPVEIGTGFSHLPIQVDDLSACIELLRKTGISPSPMELPGGPYGPKVSFVVDPDGYRIELVQWPPGHHYGITAADFAPAGQ